MLKINRNLSEDKAVFTLQGRLDTGTAPDLEKELKGCLDSINLLIMDLKDLEYISSAGLRVLLTAHKIISPKGEMKIIHANNMIMEVFEVTGFSDILNIEQDA